MPANKVINISPKKVAYILLIVIALLVLLSITGQAIKFFTGHDFFHGLIPLFFLDEEGNIPTYFSAFILLFSSCLLSIIAVFKKRENCSFWRHWKFLSFIFLYISIDEACRIHELLNPIMRKLPFIKMLHGGTLFKVAWIIPFMLGIIVLFLLFYRFFLYLPTRTKYLFFTTAALYVGGAIGLEVVGFGFFNMLFTTNNFTYTLIATLEETFEMLGVVVFIYALLEYMQNDLQEIQFQIKN